MMHFFFIYFPSRLLARDITVIYHHLKLPPLTLYIYTNNNTAVSRSYSFITVFMGPLVTAESSKAFISQ